MSAKGFELPVLRHCPKPKIAIHLRPAQERDWSECEKWVWSCIVQGREANLFEKKCTRARPDGDETNYRWPYLHAPFFSPDRYEPFNRLRSKFVATILDTRYYSNQIPALGVRIFGGYFKRSLNLENITTDKNLVVDGSILKRGVRMTNYHTSKNVSFDWSNIRGRMLLMRARIGGSLFMEHGVYDRVDLRDARIRASMEASRSVFNDIFRFDRALIEGKVHFVNSRLTTLSGWEATIGGLIELRRADIRVGIDLSGAAVSGDLRFQKVTFGRNVKGGRPRCDWDPTVAVENILTDSYELAIEMGEVGAKSLLDEIVHTRPTAKGEPTETPCDEAERRSDFEVRHEVLLRDMKIEGTLCVMDTTGAIGNVRRGEQDGSAGAQPLKLFWVERISLDGTQSNSTVLRWKQMDNAETTWRAVNFKTGHMLLSIDEYPSRHFFDNWDVKSVSFVKRQKLTAGDLSRKVGGNDEDDNRGLCDVTPRRGTIAPPDARKTQNQIVSLFSGDRNSSGSFQPFASFVRMLATSGVNTTYLNIKLSEYKNRNSCTTSVFTKSYRESNTQPWALEDRSWSGALRRMGDAWRDAPVSGFSATVDEARKLGLDSLCMVWLPVSFFTTSYGHEATNLIYFFFGFVLTFGLALKYLDKRALSPMEKGTKLGFLYSLDMFIPLSQLRIKSEHQDLLPNRWWLRWWLFFHRLAGAIISLAIFLLVFKAF